MKYAKLVYEETDYYEDTPINESFVVEYTDDFYNKVDALDRFECVMHIVCSCDDILELEDLEDNEDNVTAEEIELVKKHYEGSMINAIISYIYDNFNVIFFDKILFRNW